MACKSPLKAWKGRYVNKETGKRPVVFSKEKAYVDQPLEIPCGKCIGCKLDYSRQWAIRATHEASLYENNSFITLTYNKENLPDDRSIHKEVFQKFIKRYRKEINKQQPGTKIRYIACGEYGSRKNRPHYHAIIFNYRDPDETLWQEKQGNILFRSPVLERAWPYGFSTVGDVTFQSAAYVARYITKKITGDKAEKEYELLDKETGEVYKIEPEFALASRGRGDNKGIGYRWYQQYKRETNKEYITVNGLRCAIPKYYQNMMEKEEPERLKKMKVNKVKAIKRNKKELAPSRMAAKEKCEKERAKLLIREIEEI